jgi:hypothetical protein
MRRRQFVNANLLIKGFDALQYVTNPYALVGFMFLIGTVAIGFVKLQPRIAAGLLVTFASLVVGFAYLSLKTTVAQIQDELLVHLVRDATPSLVAKGVEVQLLEIESSKGKPFNANRPDNKHVIHEVFVRAGVGPTDFVRAGVEPTDLVDSANMNAEKWTKLLDSLKKSNNVSRMLRAEKIEDTGFAKFRVFVDGVEDRGFEDKYYFKNEYLCVPSNASNAPDCPRAKLQVVNLYNTIQHSSGESEAANLRVIRK